MSALIAGLAVVSVAVGTAAQDAEPGPAYAVVQTRDHVDRVVLPNSREIVPADMARPALPAPGSVERRGVPTPMGHHHGVGAAESRPGTPSRVQILDVRTGAVREADSPPSRMLPEAWEKGWNPGNSDDERRYQQPSWDADLTAIYDQVFPWSAHCQIQFEDPVGGYSSYGTATLIDPKTLITAGHSLHKGNDEGWYTNFRVIPAWDGDSDAYGESSVESVMVYAGWSQNGDFDYDIGFVTLNRPVGFLSGWMGYGFSNDENFYLSTGFHHAGYPGYITCYSGAPDQLYYGYGLFDEVQTYVLHADVFWSCESGGTGGAGCYWVDWSVPEGDRYVHSNYSSICEYCDPDVGGWCRITESRYLYRRDNFIYDAYPHSDPDYVPLDVNLPGTTTVTAGDQLAAMDYLVANASAFNPIGTQSYKADVYLSTDDDISESDTLIQTQIFDHNFGAKTSLRVDVAVPPTIPADTPTGDYYLGVVLRVGDIDHDNDDTDGWDAVPLRVEGCGMAMRQFGQGYAGSGGLIPDLSGISGACQDSAHGYTISNGLGSTFGFLWVGSGQTDIHPFFGGHFYVDLSRAWAAVPVRLGGRPGVPGAGAVTLPGVHMGGLQGIHLYMQATLADPGAKKDVSLTNGLDVLIHE